MNNYLKIDDVLNTEIEYLNIDNIGAPPAISAIGGIKNLFRFNLSPNDLVGNSITVGNIEKSEQGCFLNDSGYINTQSTETEEFTWIALVKKTSAGGRYYMSTFSAGEFSSTNFWRGNALVMDDLFLHLSDTSSSTNNSGGIFTSVPVGGWMLVVFSKYKNGSSYGFRAAVKTEDVQLKTFTVSSGASPNTDVPVTIGAAPYSPFPGSSDVELNYVSIHDRSLTMTEIEELVSGMQNSFEGQGIYL